MFFFGQVFPLNAVGRTAASRRDSPRKCASLSYVRIVVFLSEFVHFPLISRDLSRITVFSFGGVLLWPVQKTAACSSIRWTVFSCIATPLLHLLTLCCLSLWPLFIFLAIKIMLYRWEKARCVKESESSKHIVFMYYRALFTKATCSSTTHIVRRQPSYDWNCILPVCLVKIHFFSVL